VDTPTGSLLNARVESVLSSGLLCQVYHPELPNPIVRVFVPLTVHSQDDQVRIGSIRKNDIVRLETINRKGSLADRIITTIATFVDLVERPDDVREEAKEEPLPAPADESEYDARGDGDPLGPHAEGMGITLPVVSRLGEGEGVEEASAAAAAAAVA
jgi:hypothetical protein